MSKKGNENGLRGHFIRDSPEERNCEGCFQEKLILHHGRNPGDEKDVCGKS